MGLRTNVPGIALSEAYAPDNDNCRLVDGEVHRCKGPVREFYDGAAEKIALPRRVFPITALAAKTFTVAGDQSSYFTAGETIRCNGSTDNDGLYTVVSATFDTDHTDIVLVEDINTATADGNVFEGTTPVIHMHQLVTAAGGVEYFFVYTAYNIFSWNPTSSVLTVEWTVAAGAGCEYWQSVNFCDNVVSTNNSDAPLKWLSSAPGSHCGSLADAAGVVDKAKFVTTFENVLMFGHITAGATVYGQRIAWCDFGDDTTWAGGNAGNADITGNDAISGGFGGTAELLYILKERSIHKLWLVTTEDVFNNAPVLLGIGCRAPDSVVVDGEGRVFFYGTDRNMREVVEGEISQSIDKLVRDIGPDALPGIRGAFIEEYNEVWWAVPYSSGQATNNRILKFGGGVWNKSDLPVSSFGRFNRQSSMVWEDLPYSTWEEWAWDTWESVEGDKGYTVDLSADYDGYVYAVHGANSSDGEDVQAHFVIETDLTAKQEITQYKRLLYVQTYWRPSQTVTDVAVDVKADGAATWERVADIQFGGDLEYQVVEFPCDVRAKSFQVRVSCSAPFAFLGMVFDFELVGYY
ncbi:MAG TPA: hypothetical protein VMY87_06230 [Armatimonadota bacterium]|nr:hypothetical protein [Armatimonadota bacterium]